MRGFLTVVFVTVTSVILQGCGGASGGGYSDPGPRSLPSGQSCQSIRGELNRLDSRGVPAQVERASSGGSLNASQRSDVDRYNELLNQYLGARCHV
ncbi:hypothetical protein DLM45_16365 [Hyphomicrobium methylovorum]|uniref:hypothetical protein n=1 Tax=Hyphomicrobium methylovorum TaxID=84 RepID=UPI0015E74EDB|nr:hypothetical protein [Hyphomicrobium methylovorum]MBA2127787.1 hypothetical protein [Hyphomicrobium methylovorum]